MKNFKKVAGFCFFVTAVALTLHVLGYEALAGEDSGNWRSIYDQVMRWINFGILAFVLIKFGGTPLKDFLQRRKEELAREIKKVEDEKEELEDQIKEALKTLEESDIRFAELKARGIEQGEKEKQKIIEKAQIQSRIMMEGAKQKVDSQIKQAKNMLRAEMVDSAIALAFERLPEVITDEDSLKFVDIYLNSTLTKF
jgi:F-type H+-transporting ATPase subunit b